MSSFEDKVTAVTDFLTNRASLGRLVTRHDVAKVTGQLLAARAQRSIDTPVRLEKIYDVLIEVDRRSLETHGFMLSAVIVHMWDNEPGRRFYERAAQVGSLPDTTHQEQLRAAFSAFDAPVPLSFDPVVPDDASGLEDFEDDYEQQDDFRVGDSIY